MPLPAAVGIGPDQLLLLGVDRDHRLAGGEAFARQAVDVSELTVTVGMARALVLLGRRLQRVAQLMQQSTHQLRRDPEPFLLQVPSQLMVD